MFKVKKPSPDARILKIREYEDKLKFMQEKCQEQAAIGCAAAWEDKTNQKIALNGVMRTFAELRMERESSLNARREALAQKLFREETALQQELLDSRQTPEQKRAELARRAKALWEAREAERQATANELLARHFRENSDLLREEVSKRNAVNTLTVRQRQMEDSALRRLNELQERTQWDECENFEGIKANMRAIRDEQKRVDDMHMTERLLDEQLREKRKRLQAEAARAAEELAYVREYQAARDREQLAREERAKAETLALSAAIKNYNDTKIVLDQQRSKEELEEDRLWMKGFLERERKQIQAEQALKDRQREEMRRWKEALENASRAEAMDERDMEALIQKYQDEQWAKYDAQQKKLADARRALLDEVQDMRARQVAEKRQAGIAAIEEGMHERARMIEEDLVMGELESECKARARSDALKQRLESVAQMAYKAEKKRIEEAEKRRELEERKNAEANYQARVREASAHTHTSNFGHKRVEWFY